MFEGEINKYSFHDFEPFQLRYVIITKNAVRIYENRAAKESEHSRPMIALPLSAIRGISRIKFDSDDQRILESHRIAVDNVDQKNSTLSRDLSKNLIELHIRDEFLPVYMHSLYSKLFSEN